MPEHFTREPVTAKPGVYYCVAWFYTDRAKRDAWAKECAGKGQRPSSMQNDDQGFLVSWVETEDVA